MFFSVKRSIKISDKVYIPCVCYTLPNNLLPTVEKLAVEGKAVIYKEKVGFQNGKVITTIKENNSTKTKKTKTL